jgi:hypothetical protein
VPSASAAFPPRPAGTPAPVEIHIGRIEIVFDPPAASPDAPPSPRRQRDAAMPLAEYLRRREGGSA